MRLAVYWGCLIPTSQYAYEMSLRETLHHFNIEIIDLKEVSCCGGPVRSVNADAAHYLSMRNLAIACQTGVEDLLVPCNECHFMLSETLHRAKEDREMRGKMASLLTEEGLTYNPNLRVWHVIDLLHDIVTVDRVKAEVKKPLKGLKFAVHPGCQIIRPSEIGRVDHPEAPKKMDALIEALGAETLDYSEKLDCCGAALLYSHENAALSLTASKLKAVQAHGVDGFVDTCPYCHNLYDGRQRDAAATIGGKLSISVFYLTQLLGIALGIDSDKLGINLNQSVALEKLTSKPAGNQR